MIDWQHPRIFERLRCFGLSLFSLGLASHDASDPPVAIAAIVVAMLLALRLKIELDIGREEEESSLERKLQHISRINKVAMVPAVAGAIAMLRQITGGEISLLA